MSNAMQERMRELTELCEKYPIEIPLTELANFLHIKPESLRLSIIQGTCGFCSFAWKRVGGTHYAFSVQTLPFYLAYTGMKGA